MKNAPADPVIGELDPAMPAARARRAKGQTATVAAAATASKRSAAARSTPVESSDNSDIKSEAMKAASNAKKRAANAAAKVGSVARNEAASLTRKAEREAGHVVDSAISSVHDTVDSGKRQASGYVGAIGRAFGAASDSLEMDGLGLPATYVRAAANGLNQAADEVDGFDTTSVTSNVESYVRNNPMLTVAGLALAGFALANIVGTKRRR